MSSSNEIVSIMESVVSIKRGHKANDPVVTPKHSTRLSRNDLKNLLNNA